MVNSRKKDFLKKGGNDKVERNLTEKEYKNLLSFLVETFELTDKQIAAIHHQIPMTQELFDSILDKAEDVGPDMDRVFYSGGKNLAFKPAAAVVSCLTSFVLQSPAVNTPRVDVTQSSPALTYP